MRRAGLGYSTFFQRLVMYDLGNCSDTSLAGQVYPRIVRSINMQRNPNLSAVGVVVGLFLLGLVMTVPTSAQILSEYASMNVPQAGNLPGQSGGLWRDVNEASITGGGDRQIVPSTY